MVPCRRGHRGGAGDASPHQTQRGVDTTLDFIVDLAFSITNCRFPTRDCIPYVRSDLSQLVIRVKGFRACALHCVRANNLDFALHFGFVHRRGHHAFRESSCVSLPHGPRWLFLLSGHRKAFLLLLIRSLL